MKNKISKISEYFKIEKLKNDQRIIIFVVCLLIATTLWFLNALGEEYSTTISYPVKYINPPKNQFLANEPPAKMELKVKAHGFTLLRHKLSFSFSPIILNLKDITENIEPSSNGFRINTSTLTRQISNQVSSEITINSIQPEAFYIEIDSLKTKMVPVRSNIELNFKPQFQLKKPIDINPLQVEITGPAATIDTILFLSTEENVFKELDSEIIKSLAITHPEHTIIKPEEVSLTIPVEKFTEKEIIVPIQTINMPEDVKIKLFPSEVKLTILVGLSEFENITPDLFNAIVDYNKRSSENESLDVTIQSKPSYIQTVRHIPESVEYLIETY